MKDTLIFFIEEGKKLSPAFEDLVLNLYENPEIGFKEFNAVKRHTELLKSFGFEIEMPYVGLPTAFKATYRGKKEGRTVAYLAEYDALPEIGHGCGHNILGATSDLAAVLLRRAVDEVGGNVVVFGTCAEEMGGAKVNLARENKLKDIDVALIAHPACAYVKSGTSLALITREYIFEGMSAHAASEPWMGKNALDAQIILFNAINALRQQLEPHVRVHGIIKEGGVAANVIPDHTVSRFYFRAATKKSLEDVTAKIDVCAKAAVLATGCEVKISEYELGNDDLVTNEVLNEEFAKILREDLGEEVSEQSDSKGSSDMGNVSHVVPSIHPYFPITTKDVAGHTREFCDMTVTPYAYEKMRECAAVLATVGKRVIEDDDFYNRVRAEFNQKVKEGRIIPY